jgi:nucleoside-diphosphate-sugar epimerase
MNNLIDNKKKLNLLTGASGFLGKSILKYSNIEFITLGRSNLNDIRCNLCNEIPKVCNIDLIVHAAGMAHLVPKSLKTSNLFYETNIKGTKNLLAAFSVKNLPKKFIYISSVSVYGVNDGNLISENNVLKAIDPYGKSKIEAEELVINWCKKNNVICTILRLPLILGENPPGNLGSMIKAINKGYYFNINGGNAKKSMVLASDIAKSLSKVANIGGTYNLTDGTHPTINQLSIYIANQLGKSYVFDMPMFIAYFLAKIGDLFGSVFPINSSKLLKITSTLTFDDSKARKAFGWDPNPVLNGFKINE